MGLTAVTIDPPLARAPARIVSALDMQIMLTRIAQGIVDRPDDVRVEFETLGDETALRIFADPSDVGKLIGSQGRMARALRTILSTISMKYGHRFLLVIEEPSHPVAIPARNDVN